VGNIQEFLLQTSIFSESFTYMFLHSFAVLSYESLPLFIMQHT